MLSNQTMTATRSRTIAVIGLWIAAIGLAMLADRWVATTASARGIPQFLKAQHSVYEYQRQNGKIVDFSLSVADVLKWPGDYAATAVIAVFAAMAYPRRPRWHGGAFVLICGLLSGVNGAVKWMAGRARPFKILGTKQELTVPHPFDFQPFYNGLNGMFGTPNLCFPSGHAALAFANAAAIAILFPRWRWIAYAVATLTAMERFLETAHYFSDTVAAAALGIGGAHLLAWAFAARMDEPPGFPVEPVAVLKTQ